MKPKYYHSKKMMALNMDSFVIIHMVCAKNVCRKPFKFNTYLKMLNTFIIKIDIKIYDPYNVMLIT